MRMRMWQQLLGLLAGVMLASSALAQAPSKLPPTTTAPVSVLPAPGPALQPSPAAAAAITVPPARDAVVFQPPTQCPTCGKSGHGNGPVARMGTATRGFIMQSSGGYYGGAPCDNGRQCNNGCGSVQSDLGFLFGSCRSFFAPCSPGSLNCAGCGRGKCATPVYGRGATNPYNPCVYDSNLNH